VVTDGPLPHLRHVPANIPVAETAPPAPAQEHFAEAPAKHEAAEVAAQTKPLQHPSARIAMRGDAAPRHRALSYAGTDEARVLREREAWLRSLDRKYHFVR
jgi:hypothetical protein